jgi:hypothetical protein
MARTNLIWRSDRIMGRVNATMIARGRVAAAAGERQVKARIADPFPPASRPGQPPKRRTGALQRSVLGTVRLLTRRIRVTLSAAAPHAIYLQRGTSRMARRPFLGLPEDARLIVDILSGRRRG